MRCLVRELAGEGRKQALESGGEGFPEQGAFQDGAELPGEGWGLLGEGRHTSKLADAPTDIYTGDP